MRYRVIATGASEWVGGLAENAKAALEMVITLEKQGYEEIVIKDESNHTVSKDEIVRAANGDT